MEDECWMDFWNAPITHGISCSCDPQHHVDHSEFGMPLGFDRHCKNCGRMWRSVPYLSDLTVKTGMKHLISSNGKVAALGTPTKTPEVATDADAHEGLVIYYRKIESKEWKVWGGTLTDFLELHMPDLERTKKGFRVKKGGMATLSIE